LKSFIFATFLTTETNGGDPSIREIAFLIVVKGLFFVIRKSIDHLKQFIKENTYVSKDTTQGMITKLDREFGMVYVDKEPFIIHDLKTVKVGQRVKLEVAHMSEELPYHRIVEQVEILEEPNFILLNKEWLSKKEDHFSVLVVGDEVFSKPFRKPQREDLSLVENITVKKSLESIKKPSIFVFNSKELVFQTHNYNNLLKYLFETEQLLPIKKKFLTIDDSF
jgi:hypothetical protein